MKRTYRINENLRRYIENQDKKPTAIADKANISRDIFSRIICGKRTIYADEILPICKAAGMSINELLGQEGDEQ